MNYYSNLREYWFTRVLRKREFLVILYWLLLCGNRALHRIYGLFGDCESTSIFCDGTVYHRLYGWKTHCWPIARPPLIRPLGTPREATERPPTSCRDSAPFGLRNPLPKYVVFLVSFFGITCMLPRQLSTRVAKFLYPTW
jgi:hypothetical protein